MTGFSVDTDRMHQHAQRVAGLADSCDAAVDAAVATTMSPGMFGILGAPLVGPAMTTLQLAGCWATRSAREGLRNTADGVRTSATAFETVDGAVDRVMRELSRTVWRDDR